MLSVRKDELFSPFVNTRPTTASAYTKESEVGATFLQVSLEFQF